MSRLVRSGGTDKLELLRVILRLASSSKLSVRSFTDFLFGDEIRIGGGVFLTGTNNIFDCLRSVVFFGMLHHFRRQHTYTKYQKKRSGREWVARVPLLLLSLT